MTDWILYVPRKPLMSISAPGPMGLPAAFSCIRRPYPIEQLTVNTPVCTVITMTATEDIDKSAAVEDAIWHALSLTNPSSGVDLRPVAPAFLNLLSRYGYQVIKK